MEETTETKKENPTFIKSNINLLMICSGMLGFIIIICLFFFEDIFTGTHSINTGEVKRNLFFNYHPTYLLLLANAILQGTLWGIFIFPATAIISRIRKEHGDKPKIWMTFFVLLSALAAVFIALSITIFQYLTLPISVYYHNGVKDMIFIGMALSMGLYFLIGIVIVGKKCSNNIALGDYDITGYRRLRGYQDLLLNLTGVILSLGVISAILYHKAFIEAGGSPDQFPAEFVLLFGFFNTLLLLIFYLPNYFIMLDYGRRIVESRYPLEEKNKEVVSANFENQNRLSKNLKLDLTFTESVKKSLLILSPLLSSLLSRLFDL